jgi:hypothetical protein
MENKQKRTDKTAKKKNRFRTCNKLKRLVNKIADKIIKLLRAYNVKFKVIK